MCRYREYVYACGDSEIESPPYLPCSPDYCTPEESTDPRITIKKNTPCGHHADGTSPIGQPTDGGTSWARTNSTAKDRGRALGPGEGDPGDRLRHTVSTKIKVAQMVRSLTKKHKNKEPKSNGADGFLPDHPGQYDEIGSEMDDLKK